jgi:hypothetical protein
VNKANVLIIAKEGEKKDYLLLLSGKLFIKNHLMEELDIFETAVDDYYNGTISIFHKVELKDLEKTKITLSWLIRNRNNVSVYYLKDFNSKDELFRTISSERSSSRKRKPKETVESFV